ncbi:tyrosine-type recombinase/integrase [Arthrobacter sp. USHLN218]|uniref:tyrosine-type recombinase/integrase n=1 Tax=Arthrobacter sp. USHLN218 TaxID=3081232 RepID=UPI003018D985
MNLREKWAVLDERGLPIAEVSRFLRHLSQTESSDNTVKAYASDLAHFYTFMELQQIAWNAVTNEVLGSFIAYLRTPSLTVVRSSNPEGIRSAQTVNRCLAAVVSFARFLYDAANDTVYPRLLRTARRRRVFLTEQGQEVVTAGPRLSVSRSPLPVLTNDEIAAITDAAENLRDKFMFTLLAETGLRIGQLLLLRHSDINVPKSFVRILRRDVQPGVEARNKSPKYAYIPVRGSVIRLYAAYMHAEYKMLDSDFVFVNLWNGRYGASLSYKSVEQTVKRIREKTGIRGWSVHTFRHSFVTRLLNARVPMEVVSYLVTHSSVSTTIDTYLHLEVDDARKALMEAGVWDDR